MRLPLPRGPLSRALLAALRDEADVPTRARPADDEDLHLSLWVLYELHYRGFDEVDPALEWDPALLAVRRDLEQRFEEEVRRRAADLVERARAAGPDVVDGLREVVAGDGSGMPAYLQRHATLEQYQAYLALRSIYHLKESDPHAWVVPRVSGAVKAALAELQYDEFGDGDGDRVHAELFAHALRDAGLEPDYGAYVDRAPAHVLAASNLMSLLGLHRRLRGAALGHLAAFEMTSSLPCRRYAQGASRLGLEGAAAYYEEHVEADAVHEQVAAHAICGGLVAAEPELADDVLLGAAACVLLEEESSRALLADWDAGHTGLRGDAPLVPPSEPARQVRPRAALSAVVAVALTGLLALTGCATKVAAPASESSWRSDTDRALGGAVSSLATARLLLLNQSRGRLPQGYVVVGMRDAQTTLDTESSSYLALQPPRSRAEDHRRAVAVLADATQVLSTATAAAAQDRSARADALDAVEEEYATVEDLQQELAGP